VHAAPGTLKGKYGRGDTAFLNLAKLLSYHAQREVNAYVGITELLLGARVFQDFARGRIDTLQLMLPTAGERMMIDTSEKLLARSSMTGDQLDDIAATLDAIIAAEPFVGDVLQGEAIHMALDYGVARLKPEDWQPPGGRSEFTASNKHVATAAHDPRDDSALMMSTGLESSETYARACPPKATLAMCYANLSKKPMELIDPDVMDEQAVRVGVFPDEATRRDSKKQLLDAMDQGSFMVENVQSRANVIAHLTALRLHVQVVRDGRCPSEAQLALAPYSTLRTPAVLGDTVRVSRNDDLLLVAPPAWVTATIFQPITMKPPFPPPRKPTKQTPVSIACP
jgi:hypothetical protein